MTAAATTVLEHLDLSESANGSFSTIHPNEGWRQVFGGQLMAQSISAACKTTVANKKLASFQSTFTSPAETSARIDYQVQSIREGRSFSMRQVVAQQATKECYRATIVFQADEAGLDSHSPMPTVPQPGACADFQDMVAAYRNHFPDHLTNTDASTPLPPQPIEMRFVNIDALLHTSTDVMDQLVWIKFAAKVGDDRERHKQILAYASDQAISHLVAGPHGLGGLNPNLRLVSLDHTMWFHRPFSVDEWLLLVRRCQSLNSGRALITGEVFDQTGTLVASLTQQALARLAV